MLFIFFSSILLSVKCSVIRRRFFLWCWFMSKLYLKKEGIKYVFYQDIFRLPDMKVTVKATVESVCVVNGRLGDSALFDETFAPYLSE